MKTVIKTSIGKPLLRTYFIMTTIALGLFALPQRTQAVKSSPGWWLCQLYHGRRSKRPPENTPPVLAIRRLVGFLFRTVTDASFNTAIGAGTLALNNANENTATGAGALLNNTIGVNNVANGAFALFSNTEGSYNTAAGDQALFSNTTGTLIQPSALGRFLATQPAMTTRRSVVILCSLVIRPAATIRR